MAGKPATADRPGSGGARRGAGRPKGVPNRLTADIKSLAQSYGPDAIVRLAEIMNDKLAPHAAQVAAIKELLDRGFGKAPQAIGGAEELPPIGIRPCVDYTKLSKDTLREIVAAATVSDESAGA